jgi:hypothetical protein
MCITRLVVDPATSTMVNHTLHPVWRRRAALATPRGTRDTLRGTGTMRSTGTLRGIYVRRLDRSKPTFLNLTTRHHHGLARIDV